MAAPYYNVGTATLSAGSTAMVGQGTSWLGNIRPGDTVVSYSGQTAIVGSVNSNTSITLTRAFRGTSQTAAAYEIVYSPADATVAQDVSVVLNAIRSSALVGLSGLAPAARKLPFFDATGAAALTNLTDFARTLLDDADGPTMYGTLGPIPNAQVRSDLPPDKAFRRGNAVGTVSQSGGVPTGAIIESGTGTYGRYIRFADGTQICAVAFSTTDAINTAWGPLYFGGLFSARNWPAAFVGDLPVCSISTRHAGGIVMIARDGLATLSQTPTFYQVRSTANATTYNVSVEIIGIGRWF